MQNLKPFFSLLSVTAVLIAKPVESAEFSFFQYSNSNELFNVYWYRLPNQTSIKVFWQVDLSNASSHWAGIGFRKEDASTMGPGMFYTGQTNTLQVTARNITTAENGYPAPCDDMSLGSSGCELIDTTLHCFIVRNIDGSSQTPNVDLASDGIVLMWAHGNLQNGDISYHEANRGLSNSMNVVSLAPVLPSVNSIGVINVTWTPTPVGTIDVYANADFAEAGGITDKWLGVGMGESSDSMGRGEFYTAQSNTLQITDRFLESDDGYPPAVTSRVSNVLDSSCAISGDNLSCYFSRMMNTSSQADSVSVIKPVYVLWAVGNVVNGSIDFHYDKSITADTVAMYNVTDGSEGIASSSNAAYQAHAIMMIIAWLWILPYGMYVAKFKTIIGFHKKAGSMPPLWWRLHQAHQYIGVVLVTASIVVIFVKVNQSWTTNYLSNSTTKGAHQICGILAFILMILQPINAIFRNGCNETNESKRHNIHKTWHYFHAIGGYTALLLALVACGLGMNEYNYSLQWPHLFFIGYVVSVGGLIVAIVVTVILTAQQKQKLPGKTPLIHNTSKIGKTFPWMAYIAEFVLFAGTAMCVATILKDPDRKLEFPVL